mmetsp:Transcript_2712/g.7347  ORF Transcript_2712/g.7347 Transcript_2712/m.7347 type:complete len:202 (+) Transcript_2712:2240-2845(+)
MIATAPRCEWALRLQLGGQVVSLKSPRYNPAALTPPPGCAHTAHTRQATTSLLQHRQHQAEAELPTKKRDQRDEVVPAPTELRRGKAVAELRLEKKDQPDEVIPGQFVQLMKSDGSQVVVELVVGSVDGRYVVVHSLVVRGRQMLARHASLRERGGGHPRRARSGGASACRGLVLMCGWWTALGEGIFCGVVLRRRGRGKR